MVLFDLDGTILNSAVAILRSYRAAIQETLGFEIDPDEEHIHELLRRRPIEYFQQHYPPHAEGLARLYAELYSSKGVAPYQGLPDLLQRLAQQTTIGIVSNKGRARILSDLASVGLDPALFAIIAGAEDSDQRKPHPAPILNAMARLGQSNAKVLYVGDGPHDVFAARGANAIAVAVSWGYYPLTELKGSGPDHIAATPQELAEVLTKHGYDV